MRKKFNKLTVYIKVRFQLTVKLLMKCTISLKNNNFLDEILKMFFNLKTFDPDYD
jgi:hypothetical protein